MPAPSPSRPQVSNEQARRLFLDRHGLSRPPNKESSVSARLQSTIQNLGFVQIDSINTVARAHHMILRSRLGTYRENQLKRLYEKDRQLFEQWTHDASFIPMEFFPHWKHKFTRDKERLSGRWERWQQHDFQQKFQDVLHQIAQHGPATSGDVGKDEPRSKGGWWEWHPSKTALEFLWRTGALSVTGRDGFKKVYDLTENVVPDHILTRKPELEETIAFACQMALDRLGFATSGELAAFLDLITPNEAKTWALAAEARGEIQAVDILDCDGRSRTSYMRPLTLQTMETLPNPPGKVRILSPFDPMLRDRKRAMRLFDFDYKIEVFVPEPLRTYGYYVFPVLEGSRMIGRIDMRANRKDGSLNVIAYWPERGIRASKARDLSLEKELYRLARFCQLTTLSFEKDWQRETR
ncbi:YcaQ family DNA glycosylase [Roseibium sp. CAU 1637]|uniref:YcaQ family DNA glycosylase n=1 Tax=Roseibium limicola TaxID=2816037 RepID=A0A939ENN7_9HYPH|nr:crosslink repair DNA glycosylase YcaQ family protein [Roseibium limicola]MBO0346090.1 YcaQ family DNA glycosylase [Roseibium limicola]